MKIQIPTESILSTWSGTAAIFTEAWVTLDGWLKQGKIIPSNPSIDNGNSLFESGGTQFYPTQNELLSIGKGNTGDANGIIYESPLVWEADIEILDLQMPETIPAWIVPDGGVDVFPEIYKLTSTGTVVKTVGEWIDSLCTVWRNDVTGKIHIYTSPIGASFIQYHLVRAFKQEFTVSNYPVLTEDTDIIIIPTANSDHTDPNWVKIQPV